MYKWHEYAKYLFYFGFAWHCIYMTALGLLIHDTYMVGRYGNMESPIYVLIMAVCIIYPYCYDTVQLFQQKHTYFYEFWNWIDFFY